MQWLASISVRRPIFASVLILMVLVFGAIGYAQLGVDRFPDVDFPTVSVITRMPGAAPKEVETEVSSKIEEAVNTIGGIDELRSTSSEGVSQVFVTFVLEKDIEVAAQEVRDRVNSVLGELPADVEPPTIAKLDPAATPIMYLAVNAEKPILEVTEVADKLVRRRIESTAGVGQVAVVGGAKRQINIWLDSERLRALGITPVEVQRAISSSNLTIPGGRVESGPEQQVLRVQGRVKNPAELADYAVAVRGGQDVRLRDVARVADSSEQAETAASRDGKPAVILSIRKQSGANSVAVVDEVRSRLTDIAPELPAGYSLEVVRDSTQVIRTSVDAVTEHLVLGAFFAGIVVLLFLGNLRSTLIAAIAIPVSIIGTFLLMWLQGFTLNTITLLALALAVGIVIDDAIVVLENIHRFIEQKALSPMKAAILATREIGLAVMATTLSLVAVFLPVALMTGIVGRFLKSFGMTMAFSILVSMLVSFTLTPMLSSRWLASHRPHAAGKNTKKPVLERLVDYAYLPIERGYVRLLGWVMKRRWVVVTASALALAASVPLLGKVPKGFLPRSDEAQFEINVQTPEGTSLEATAIVAERIARDVRGQAEVEATLVTIGDNHERAANLARVYTRLSPPDARKANQFEVMDRVRRDVVAKLPRDLQVDVSEVPMFSGGSKMTPVMYEISGPDLDQLESYSNQLLERARKVPGATDVISSLVGGKPEVSLHIDRDRAADLGVKVADVAATLKTYVGGEVISSYEEDGESYDVFMRGEAATRDGLDALALLTVPSAKLGTVPLFDVVRAEQDTGPGSITRLNRRRQVQLFANLTPDAAQGSVQEGFEREIKALNLKPGYRAAPVGQSKEMGRAGLAFLVAFGLSFVFMYLVLAAQFESWLHPVTILLALPLTLPFALLSVLIFKQQLDIYSLLGLLVLFGVVKKNSILQIDHTNHLRAGGMEREKAILEANRDRLRPILMTTVAFVAGMLPLMFSSGVGAGFNQATASIIIGGQTFSLLLTLLATPVAYSLFDDLSSFIRRRFGNPTKQSEAARELKELSAMDSTGQAALS